MRVVGIDPGLTRCGVGVVDTQPGSSHKLQFVSAGVIRTSPANSVDQRLMGIWQGVSEWLDEFKPDWVAVERVFAQHNLHTVMGTAQAAGIAITAAALRGIPVAWHTPSEIKAAVTGSGRADKAQVQLMVQRLLRLAQTPNPPDAADALALAITHHWRPTSLARGSAQDDGARDPASTLRSAQDDGGRGSAQGDEGSRPSAQQQWLDAEAAAKRRKR